MCCRPGGRGNFPAMTRTQGGCASERRDGLGHHRGHRAERRASTSTPSPSATVSGTRPSSRRRGGWPSGWASGGMWCSTSICGPSAARPSPASSPCPRTRRWTRSATDSGDLCARPATPSFWPFALGWAEVLGASDIFIGANALDYSGYPDCRPEYIQAFQRMANLATRAGVGGGPTAHHPHPADRAVQAGDHRAGPGAGRGLRHHPSPATIPRPMARPAAGARPACSG